MKRSLAMYYAIVKNFIRGLWEEFLALTIATLGNFITGIVFGLGSRIISVKPSVLIVAPATMAMRGNIYSSLGSRLGSLLHLGHVEPRISKNPILVDNVSSVLTQTTLMGTYLGIISSILYFILEGKVEFADLIFITSLTGFLALPFMLLITFSVTFLTYLKGLDPDNFSVPIITFTGDAISLPLLLISTYIVLKLTFEVKCMFIIFLILFLVFLIIRVIVRGRKYLRRIVYESFPVLTLCGFLEMIAGLALIVNVERILEAAGILTMVPGFLEDGGAIGGILAAKISTKLHIGDIEPRIVPSKTVVEEFCKAYFLSIIIFPTIGVYGYLISSILSLNVPPFTTLIVVMLTSGFILTFFISLLVYLISIVSFKKGVDPDNVTIPMVTSTIDAIGMFILVYVLLFFYRV